MSLSSVSEVLSVPELLGFIFSYLMSKELASAAILVNKQWSDMALNQVWQSITPRSIFHLLAPFQAENTQRPYIFTRTISAINWTRFNHHYAQRVRKLDFDDQTKGWEFWRLQPLFDQVARTRITLKLLPNLHELRWLASTTESLQAASVFMQDTVRDLIIKLPFNVPIVSFIEDIILRMPKVTLLDIRSRQSVNKVRTELAKLVNGLTELKKIVLPRYYIDGPVLELLSQLPHLKVIEFEFIEEQGDGDPHDVICVRPSLAPGSFLNLSELAITANLTDMRLLLSKKFVPINLTALYVGSLGGGLQQIVTSVMLHQFLNVVASECQLLTELILDFLTTLSPPKLPARGTQFTLETLRPLLSRSSLVAFGIIHEYPIRLSNDDIEEISRSWPNIERLLLNCEPVAMLDATQEEGALPLDAMEHIARNCLKIRELGLFLNASPDGAENRDLPCFHNLQKLFVGVSHISDEQGVALYLVQILPPGCLLSYGATWYAGPAGLEPLVSTEFAQKELEISRRCNLWIETRVFLSVLTKLRHEEAQNGKKLELELRALKDQLQGCVCGELRED